jgi:hypothetical protein
MQGGAKGLLQNSAGVCASSQRATVTMEAHSGKVHDFKPLLKNGCGGKGKRHSGYRRR